VVAGNLNCINSSWLDEYRSTGARSLLYDLNDLAAEPSPHYHGILGHFTLAQNDYLLSLFQNHG